MPSVYDSGEVRPGCKAWTSVSTTPLGDRLRFSLGPAGTVNCVVNQYAISRWRGWLSRSASPAVVLAPNAEGWTLPRYISRLSVANPSQWPPAMPLLISLIHSLAAGARTHLLFVKRSHTSSPNRRRRSSDVR